MKPRIIKKEESHAWIAKRILSQKPFAMGKLGATETRALYYFQRWLKIDSIYSLSWLKYAKQLHLLSGVYPIDKKLFEQFAEIYTKKVIPQCDFFSIWQHGEGQPGTSNFRKDRLFGTKENRLITKYSNNATAIRGLLDDFSSDTWLASLEGKKVLVISPFVDSVQLQHPKRKEIWRAKPACAPDFDLRTLRCPQYSHLVPPIHPDWVSALNALKTEVSQIDYDVMLVGAGAWGLPLAAFAKESGKVGIHMGGNLQLVFGIKGKRWDDWSNDYNEYWAYPSEAETPKGTHKIEGACYWGAVKALE